MVKVLKKIAIVLGMIYLVIISVKEMVNVLDLYNFNKAIYKNINILQNAYREGLGIQ